MTGDRLLLSSGRMAHVLRLVALITVALLVVSEARADQIVRIAVGRFKETLQVSGPGLVVTGGDGARVTAAHPLVLSAGADGILVAGKPVTHETLIVRSNGELTVRGHRYRSILEITWRSYRGRPELLVVHPLPLETYVVGIVSSELPTKWPLEALKAQAVAARTYAVWQKYRRLDLPYHMESTVLDQVYHGVEREHPDAIRAVLETRGVVLSHAKRPVQAYFHASCGDHTESAAEGWGTDLPYLPGSPCGACTMATRYRWAASIPRAKLDAAFNPLLGERVEKITIVDKTKTGRVKTVRLEGKKRKKTIAGADLRRLLGYDKVWSTMITKLALTSSALVVEGKGAGHGVGMCQWGSRGFAEQGESYDRILRRYYPGARLTRMY
jgi:stage II sporulation protein D